MNGNQSENHGGTVQRTGKLGEGEREPAITAKPHRGVKPHRRQESSTMRLGRGLVGRQASWGTDVCKSSTEVDWGQVLEAPESQAKI